MLVSSKMIAMKMKIFKNAKFSRFAANKSIFSFICEDATVWH